MRNKVYLDEQGIIVIEVIGDQNEASVEHMGQEVSALVTEQRKLAKPCLVLDNLLQMGDVDAEARKLVVRLAKELDYDRAALVGKGGLMKFGTSLMLRATGRGYKVHYYEDEHQARSWLLGAPQA